MKGAASACGSATVVNAIATGKGAAFAIDLEVRADVELTDRPGKIIGRIVGEPSESPKLIEICARKVLKRFKADKAHGARVKTRSRVPLTVGLSSSSAAANATVLATAAALNKKLPAREALNLAIDSAFEAGVTVTGAFDDAAASFFGCGVITDNSKRRILKRFEVDPKLDIVIYVPPGKCRTSEIDVARTKLLAEFVSAVHRVAFEDQFSALTLNGLLYCSSLGYDPAPALEALRTGALAAGLTGTGPAFVAIAKPATARQIKRRWQRRPGKILMTKPATKGATRL